MAILILVAVVLAGVGCNFSPPLSSGKFRCQAAADCPRGYTCGAAGLCCAATSSHAACTDVARADGGAGGLVPGAEGAETTDPGLPDAASDGPASDGPAAIAGPPAVRVVEGKVDLVSGGASCTHATANRSSDRWCAFNRGTELWVLNVTRAHKQSVKCDGSDAACLRLTSTLVGPNHPNPRFSYSEPAFNGDTLLFSADALMPEGIRYRGGVWAWYPGWPSARRLTSENGWLCQAASEAPAVWCRDRDAAGQYELLAGVLDPVKPLVLVKKLLASAFAEISSDGQFLAYEELPLMGSGPGTLWVLPTKDAGNPAAHVLISKDVVRGWWYFSLGGASLYFLQADVGTGDDLLATLSMVDVRNPTVVGNLATRVGDFRLLAAEGGADFGVAALQDVTAGVGVLRLFLGEKADKVVIVGTSTAEFAVSPGARYTFLQPLDDPATARRDARIADHAASTVCALQKLPQTVIYRYDAFTPNSELAFWLDYPERTQTVGEGWMARTQGCADKRRFANRLYSYATIGNAGLVYLDEFTAEAGGTMRLVKWGEGMSWPTAGPVTVQANVRPLFGIVISAPREMIVYASHVAGSEGLYLVELPF